MNGAIAGHSAAKALIEFGVPRDVALAIFLVVFSAFVAAHVVVWWKHRHE